MYDAEDLDERVDYLANIEPTLVRERNCYFELPRAEFSDYFELYFDSLFSDKLAIGVYLQNNETVRMTAQAPEPTPTPVDEVQAELTPNQSTYIPDPSEEKNYIPYQTHRRLLSPSPMTFGFAMKTVTSPA